MKAIQRKDLLEQNLKIPAKNLGGKDCNIEIPEPVECMQQDDRVAVQMGNKIYVVDSVDLDFIEDKSISVKWHIDDIHEVCKQNNYPKLTDKQAMEILKTAERRHDANEGINWIVLDAHIDIYINDNDIK